jgi:hypothetical protein
VIKTEELDPILALTAEAAMRILKEKYGLAKDDFPQPFADAIGISARLGWGLVFKEYGGGRQADGEYFAQVRKVFTDAGVHWQTHSCHAGYGGGTIAQWFANADIDAIDVGIGILSMHSPMDVSAKVDLWELYRGFKAFLGVPSSTAATASR